MHQCQTGRYETWRCLGSAVAAVVVDGARLCLSQTVHIGLQIRDPKRAECSTYTCGNRPVETRRSMVLTETLSRSATSPFVISNRSGIGAYGRCRVRLQQVSRPDGSWRFYQERRQFFNLAGYRQTLMMHPTDMTRKRHRQMPYQFRNRADVPRAAAA